MKRALWALTLLWLVLGPWALIYVLDQSLFDRLHRPNGFVLHWELQAFGWLLGLNWIRRNWVSVAWAHHALLLVLFVWFVWWASGRLAKLGKGFDRSFQAPPGRPGSSVPAGRARLS